MRDKIDTALVAMVYQLKGYNPDTSDITEEDREIVNSAKEDICKAILTALTDEVVDSSKEFEEVLDLVLKYGGNKPTTFNLGERDSILAAHHKATQERVREVLQSIGLYEDVPFGSSKETDRKQFNHWHIVTSLNSQLVEMRRRADAKLGEQENE